MNPRVLISLENEARAALKAAMEPQVELLHAVVTDAINCNERDRAEAHLSRYNMQPAVDALLPRYEEIAVSAAIFGASRLQPPHLSLFTKGEGLERVLKGAAAMSRIAGTIGTRRIRKHGLAALQARTGADARSVISKSLGMGCCAAHTLLKADRPKTIRVSADQDDISDALNAATRGNGRIAADIASNLTTTRLAAYGFLAQAQKDGVKHYQVSAELDDRTCPVCMYMHGKTFDVGKSLKQSEDALDADDPDDLEDISPWPDQTKGGIEDLLTMDERDMEHSKFMSPPYHPGCRCLLVPTGSISSTIEPMGEGKASRLMEAKGWFDRLFGMAGEPRHGKATVPEDDWHNFYVNPLT